MIYQGEGFAENQYDHEARVRFNESNPNHFRSGFGDRMKKRSSGIFCHNDINPVPAVEMTRINGKVICG